MRRSRLASIVALGAAATLMLAACGGGGGETAPGGDGAAAGGGSYSIVLGSDPENPLVPGNTTESEGNQVMKALFTPLVNYNVDTVEVEYTAVAESIESEDNLTWTVTLKDGWTFHDGTPVTAQSFVDAWNYTANVANAQGGAYFFSNIAGYDAENPVEAMSGLAVVDDTTFTVTLAEAFAQFPLTVGYSVFAPLPQAFYADPEAFGRQPIGNGPFRADGEYVQGQGITLSKFAEYAGENQAVADSVEFRVISDINTAYNELIAGNLDVLRYTLPPELSVIAQDELGDRYFEREASSFTYVAFPLYDPRFQDPRVRQAFSMAVDRQSITDAIFSGTRTPAYDVIPPTIDGHRPDACEFCVFDVARAQQLLAESGFDTSQPIELWFNSGAGHDQWVQAVGNQLQQNLGITYSLRGDLDFAQYLPLGDEQGFTGPFRLGWSMDYPSPQNFLEPLFSTSALPPAGSNAAFYSNPEFDRLVDAGNTAATNEEAIALYQQADDLLLSEMPIMPMFYGFNQGGHSERVDNVRFDAFSDIVLTEVTPNAG
jgi:oligopeptide transport system substrate-binding protein